MVGNPRLHFYVAYKMGTASNNQVKDAVRHRSGYFCLKLRQRIFQQEIQEFPIKRAWYVYVRDFKYIVCFSEYLSIFFRAQ